jgi:hypothetical protein
MIYDFKYEQSVTDREDVKNYLRKNKFKTVVDIGFSACSWSAEFTTHYVDAKKSENAHQYGFIGNISTYAVWENLLEFVKKNGKFNFSICTHTLEDISCPQMVCELLPRISKEGYIAVPSKYRELTRHEGYTPHNGYINNCGGYMGWVHHRWVFNKEGNEFVGYPKLPLMEHIDFSSFGQKTEKDLRFFWKDDFKLKVINDDWLGPTDEYVRELYRTSLFKD